MPRPWKPTRRCARSCGATAAKATGDAQAAGDGERDRDADGRGPDPAGPPAAGQAAVQPGLDLADGSGGQDCQDEGRPHPAGLQARARGRSRHWGHRRGGDPWRRSRRHHDPAGNTRGGRSQPGGGRCRPDRERSGRARSGGARTLHDLLCVQEERQVGNDNRVRWQGRVLQIPPSPLRPHFVRSTVRLHHYPDGTIAIFKARTVWPPSHRRPNRGHGN